MWLLSGSSGWVREQDAPEECPSPLLESFSFPAFDQYSMSDFKPRTCNPRVNTNPLNIQANHLTCSQGPSSCLSHYLLPDAKVCAVDKRTHSLPVSTASKVLNSGALSASASWIPTGMHHHMQPTFLSKTGSMFLTRKGVIVNTRAKVPIFIELTGWSMKISDQGSLSRCWCCTTERRGEKHGDQEGDRYYDFEQRSRLG